MRFLLAVIDNQVEPATSAEMAAIDAFNERLQEQGHRLMAAGLEPAPKATVVDGRGDEPSITPGPVTPAAEWMSGFWVIEAANLDEALALAVEGSEACNRRIEVRAFLR